MDFQVNYAALDAAAADITTGANNLQNCLDDLEQPYLHRCRCRSLQLPDDGPVQRCPLLRA